MNNPFVYGKEVSGYQFYDRTNEADELYRHMKDGSTKSPGGDGEGDSGAV